MDYHLVGGLLFFNGGGHVSLRQRWYINLGVVLFFSPRSIERARGAVESTGLVFDRPYLLDCLLVCLLGCSIVCCWKGSK